MIVVSGDVRNGPFNGPFFYEREAAMT